MRRALALTIVNAAVILAAVASACAQPAPTESYDATRLLLKVAANYRSCTTYRSEATWTHKVGDKEHRAGVTLAAKRPNLYRLSITGAYLDTEVASDGQNMTALRSARKVYTSAPAPKQLIGSDTLKGIALPAPATRIITLLLEGRWRDTRNPLSQRLQRAEVSGPRTFGDNLAYVLSFDYDADYSAKVYVTQKDFIVRRVALYRSGVPTIVENLTRIEFDKPLATDGFGLRLPEGARRLTTLPAPDEPYMPVPLSVETLDGRRIALSDLRGKMVLLNFFFTTCGPCNAEFPHLVEAYEKFKDKGLEIIAVNGIGESKDAILTWAQGHGASFPIALNKSPSDLVAKFQVRAYPTNVVFDREGKVVYRGEGFDPQAILKALAEGAVR